MISRLFPALLGIFILLIGCSESQLPNSDAKTLHLNLQQDPTTFDPRCARRLSDLTLITHLFEGLTRIDANGKPIPALAKEISISDDKLNYTFHLRESYWSDGSKICASDFVYAWKKVLNPSFATDYAHMLFVIKNGKKAKTRQCSLDDVAIKAVDENTLTVTLENPIPYFLFLTAFPVTFPIQNGLDEKNPNWMLSEQSIIYNGPFKISQWKKSFILVFEKNENYWDKEHVALNCIDFTMINDSATESYLFEKGEIDWLGQPLSNAIFSELLHKLKEENKLLSYDVSGTYILKIQTEKEPFNDSKLRKAFAYAISRKKIINHILQGNQKIATSFLPPSLQLHLQPYFEDENIALAQKLFEEVLAEKKYTRDTFPKITISYFISERNAKIVQLVQEMWHHAFGIKIELNGIELQCFRQRLKAGDFQIATGDWIADFQDPISFLEIFQYKSDDKKNSYMNDTRWYNDTYADLLEKASGEKEDSVRMNYLHLAEQILMNEMPIIPLYHYSFDYIKKDHIKNVILSPLGIADYKYVEIEKR